MSDNTSYSRLMIDPRGVARLTLNRPEVHNAFDDSLIAELNAHLDKLHDAAQKGEVRVVVRPDAVFPSRRDEAATPAGPAARSAAGPGRDPRPG